MPVPVQIGTKRIWKHTRNFNKSLSQEEQDLHLLVGQVDQLGAEGVDVARVDQLGLERSFGYNCSIPFLAPLWTLPLRNIFMLALKEFSAPFS